MARNETDDGRGRTAGKPQEIPAKGWKDVLWRVYVSITEDNVMLVAGGVTFYLLLAIFPALAAFVSLYGLFADPATIAQHLSGVEGVLPEDAVAMLQEQLTSLAQQQGSALTWGFVISFALAFWSANSGMKGIIEALNIAYDEEEKRSFVKLTLISFAFTLGAFLLAMAMILAVAVVPAAMAILNLGAWGELAVRVIRWPILLLMIAAALNVVYRYAPSRDTPEWRWVTWGSGIATVVWIVTSIAFTLYLENFADYNATYGSLGALVGFLLWIWISSIIVLIGAELNAELEHQTARDTTTGPERPMGERGAIVADTLGESAE